MRRQSLRFFCAIALLVIGGRAPSSANDIARFIDPSPGPGGETMFEIGLAGSRLYGGWIGPPRIELQTPLGIFPDCTMWLPPMRVEAGGRVVGGQIVFFMHNQVEVLRIGFTNGLVNAQGFRCGVDTGGTVSFVLSPGGVQIPPDILQPLQQPWFAFEFHNPQQTPNGPAYTASFRCGARGMIADLNCDGRVNNFDIDPFVLALSDPVAFAGLHPFCDRMLADTNLDGVVDNFDIDGFVLLLTNH